MQRFSALLWRRARRPEHSVAQARFPSPQKISRGALLTVFLLGLATGNGRAATFTWTGSVSGNWFDQNNWNPTGVPGTNDTVNVSSGTITLTNAIIINGVFNWSGGALAGSGMFVTANGALNISASASKNLENILTNAGTVTFSGGNFDIYNNNSGFHGGIWNLAGGVFNFAGDFSISCGCYGPEFFNNQGLVEKTAGTSASYFGVNITNSGTIQAQTGTLNLNNGGSLNGVLEASSGASLNLTSGTFYVGVPTVNGPGNVTQAGGTVDLLNEAIANFQLNAGTLDLDPGFEAGSITNLTISGVTLTGNNLVTGTLNWLGGTVSGPLTIEAPGVLNLNGSGTKTLYNTLTNFGVVNFLGSGGFSVVNNLTTVHGQVWNKPGGVFDIGTDQSINCGCYGNEFFNNQGTIEKTAGTGSTYISVTLTNSGTIEAAEGTLFINGGGDLGGAINASSGAAIDLDNGAFFVEAPTLTGPGTIEQTGGTLTLTADAVTNLQLNGGSLVLGPSFQGGAITNLTISGITLTGTNKVTGVLNWLSGAVNGPLTIASGASLNLLGSSSKVLQNALTNAGSVVWTNGTLSIWNNNSNYRGAIWNLPGGVFNLQSDLTISCGCYGDEFFNNAGTLEKTGGVNTANIDVVLTNSGAVQASSGTLALDGGGNLAGSISAASGAAVDLNAGAFSIAALAITGPGTVAETGGTLTLTSDVIPHLQLTGGTLFLGPIFQGGAITNLTIAGVTLSGTNAVTGTLNWTGGTINGPLTVAIGATLNISGPANKSLQSPLTNSGTVFWSGGALTIYNSASTYRGAIWNLPGAVFNIGGDVSLGCACYGYEFFNNQGLLEKTAAAGTTSFGVIITNSGSIQALSGTINFNNGGSIGGNVSAASGSAINLNNGNFYVSLPSLAGPGLISFSGGNLTLLNDIIPNLQLTGGTLSLGPSFQGGTITNLTIAGTTLTGTNTVTGTLNWLGGVINTPLTIEPAGSLDISGSSTKTLEAAVTNLGTINWSGGNVAVYNNAGAFRGAIWNLPGAVFYIACDQSISCACYGFEFFDNQGTVEKTAAAGSTYIGVNMTNSGLVEVDSGNINFNGGGSIGGVYETATNTAINFSSGSFYAGVPMISGPGSVQFTGGTMTLLADEVPNLGLTGGFLLLANTFQGGAITNLTVAGAALGGTNVVNGVLNWVAGALTGPLTISSNGVLVLTGASTKAIENTLTNFGDVIWSGTGSLYLYNNNAAYKGTIYNEPSGLFQIQNDQYLTCACYGDESFVNYGLVEKSVATNTSVVALPFTNNGAISFDGGVVDFTGVYAQAGATLDFALGATNNFGRGSFNHTLDLDGALKVHLFNGYTPRIGDFFPLLSYSSLAGGFATLNLPGLPSGRQWQLDYPNGEAVLRVVASPPIDSLSISGSLTDTNGKGIAGATVYAYVPAVSFTNAITNGSFELPTNNGQAYIVYNPGSTAIPGWTVFGAGAVDISGPGEGQAEDGAQFWDGTGNGGGMGGGISQTFPTVSGRAYKLSFFNGYGSGYTTQPTLGVTVAGVSNSYAPVYPGAGSLNWFPQSIYFTASSSTATVTFQTVTTYNSDNEFVDNVQVTPPDAGRLLTAVTDGSGHYSLAVANGTFQVGVSGLAALGFNSVAEQPVTVTTSGQTANFTAQSASGGELFAITTSVSPPGSGVSSGDGAYAEGATATVSGTPITTTLPYLFGSWTENGVFQSASPSYSFPVNHDRHLVANFVLPLYAISVSKNPSIGGVVTGAGSYTFNTTNTLTALPNFGFAFSNWTQGAMILGTSPSLSFVALSNAMFTANYVAINLSHAVTLVTSPPGLATPTGAGTYTNGQTATFTTPTAVTNSPYYYTFSRFTLSNTVVSYATNFSKTFSTLDATNLQYVAIYNTNTILPTLASIFANYSSPVPATTNFQLTLLFDRSMNTNAPPVVLLTNSAAVVQPVVKTNGYWTSYAFLNDTYHTPPITFSPGMDGTNKLIVSGARDLNGDFMVLTNPVNYIIEATPPPAPILTVSASNSSSVTVSWNSYAAPADIGSFRIYLQTTNYASLAGVPIYNVVSSVTRSYQFGGLGLNTNYYIAVQAVDTAGNALTNAAPLVVSLPSSLPPPVSIVATPTGGNSATLSWSGYNSASLFGLAGFRIYYQQANFASVNGLTPQATVGPNQTSFQVSGLDRSQTTYFAVVAFNNTNGYNPNVTTASWSDPYAGVIGASLSLGGAGQVINIYHSITVESNATLTIQPGTTLLFDPGTSLTVAQGALFANGTALSPVIFDSAHDVPGLTPAAGDWGGVTLGSGAGSSFLQFVEVLYGGGLTLNGCAPTVQDFTATGNTPCGLCLSNGASLTTSAALLAQNVVGARQADNSLLTIQNSVLQNNATNAWGAGSLQLNATSDWWGAADSTAIGSSIAGNVSFNQFLTYAPLLTPAIGASNNITQIGTNVVGLDLACRTAIAMRVSEDFTFTGVFFGPFTNQTAFTLSPGGGVKHIFAQFRSTTGQTNSPLELDVNYITAGPVIQSFSLNNGQTLSRPLTITAAASATLGMQDLELYLDGVGLATNAGGSLSYYFDVRPLINAVHQVVLLARDTAGHITTAEASVIVAVTPPPAPVITVPPGDYVTNNAGFAVSGTAEPRLSIQLTDNGAVLGTATANPTNGAFSFSNLTLAEGANTVVAIASDATDTGSSNPRHVTVETIPPAALVMNQPVYTPGTGLRVTWMYATSGKQATSFQLFWANAPFTATNQATGHSIPLSVMSDTLAGLANGTYYFGVIGSDAAGNTSPLSSLVSYAYDATAPSLAISYTKPSPVGLGPLGVTLTSTKALAATPSLTIQPSGTGPTLLALTNVALNTWQSTFVVSSSTPSGNASVQGGAQDQAGNVFNGAPSGAQLTLDTVPPSGRIATVPPTPIQNVNSTNAAVNLVLSKLAGPGTTPTLVFQAPIGTKTPITLTGSGSNWSGTLTITPAMGTGFGKFLLSAQDSVGNVGSNITAGLQLELYNTPLPTPPPDPTGLSGVSLAGGGIRLTWSSVSNAQIYRLYREPGTNFTMPGTLDIDNITNSYVVDVPPTDGLYAYAVSASRLGSESGFASALIALSDRTPPPAPTNVAIALAASGVQISWQQPSGEIPNHYNLYRNGSKIGSSSTLSPLVDYPPRGTNVYVVSSVDAIGNENPSQPATNILLVSPVVSLEAVVSPGQAPSLSWVSTDNTASGFNVYRNGVRQTLVPLTTTNFIDSIPLSDAVTYSVTAVNASSEESPPRLVHVYPLGLGLTVNPPSQQILVNYFDQYQLSLTNLAGSGAFALAQFALMRSVNGASPLTVTQAVPASVNAGSVLQQSVIVPEAAVPAAQTVQLIVAGQTDSQGSSVIYNNAFSFTNVSTPGVEIALSANQLPLAGGLNPFLANIQNLGSTPIQIITSRGDGAQPGDLYISVRNSRGQEVSRTPYQGVPPGTFFLGDGRGYSQISPGASLGLTLSNVLVPAALTGATNTTFVAVVSNIYSQIGSSAETVSGPLTGSMVSSSLAEPPYYGTAQTDMGVYTNNQPIMISGQAISYSTGLPVPNAALNIGFATRGYTWTEPVTTDSNGNFTYTYEPAPGFAGTLSIWAANPEVVDQLNQAGVIVYRAYASPAAGQIEMSKNGSINFNIQLINPGNVPLTGFTVSCQAYQVTGTNMTPIGALTGSNVTASGFGIAANASTTVALQLNAAPTAPSTAEAIFTFTSGEGAVATLTTTVTLLPATPVLNVVSPAQGYVELNVDRGGQVSSQVTIVNSGLATLSGITIQPPTNLTWMQVNLPVSGDGLIHLPDLAQGQSNTFTVVFTPPANTPLAMVEDDLIISGANLAVPYRLNLFAIVTSDLTGAVQFQVEDFLADYLDGASIRLQNNLLQSSVGPVLTDTNGIATITNLTEGVWNWQVIAPGCAAASGTVTIQADQTAMVNPILSRNLVTVNFTVVPVPFTDQYEIQVSQTFSTFVPAPELVLTPPYTTFNNVTPGFQGSFNVTAQNPGLIQLSDVTITGQSDNQATVTPLITYLPVLLPQQSVQIPVTATYAGTNAPGQQDLNGALNNCLPANSGVNVNAIINNFLDNLAISGAGSGMCQITGATLQDDAAVAVGFDGVQAVVNGGNGTAADVNGNLETAQDIAACLVNTLIAAASGGGGSAGGGGPGGLNLSSGMGGASGGGGCLAADTLVLMADGSSKPISQVQTNDLVRCGAQAGQIATVTGVYALGAEHLSELVLAGASSRVLATAEHFFWVDGKGWTAVSRLRPGDWLFNDAGRRVRIARIGSIDTSATVYTLKLSGDVAFYANHILTHEMCGPPPEPVLMKTATAEVAK